MEPKELRKIAAVLAAVRALRDCRREGASAAELAERAGYVIGRYDAAEEDLGAAWSRLEADLAANIREAVRKVLADVRLDLPENPTVQEIVRRAAKGWRLRETEIDVVIDRITRAVGTVLIREDDP